ncbi:MAG: UvrD-helicase domain-containing protein, partial [Pyrinomonadaceae bacterium]
MNKWEHVRRAARELREKICSDKQVSSDSVTPAELIALTAGSFGIELIGLPAEHSQMGEGVLARLDDELLYFRNDVDQWLAWYYQAHELGHVELDHGKRECTSVDIDPDASETKMPFGVHRVEGYGPDERIECEANIFAREFLLPRDVLTRWFVEEKLKADMIADRTGMAIDLVCHQLAFALLTPEIAEQENMDDEESSLTLDDSQKQAAEVPKGPQLVDAGPGTGKTRTLVGRVLFLLASGVSPKNILVLTFSNKASEEL